MMCELIAGVLRISNGNQQLTGQQLQKQAYLLYNNRSGNIEKKKVRLRIGRSIILWPKILKLDPHAPISNTTILIIPLYTNKISQQNQMSFQTEFAVYSPSEKSETNLTKDTHDQSLDPTVNFYTQHLSNAKSQTFKRFIRSKDISLVTDNKQIKQDRRPSLSRQNNRSKRVQLKKREELKQGGSAKGRGESDCLFSHQQKGRRGLPSESNSKIHQRSTPLINLTKVRGNKLMTIEERAISSRSSEYSKQKSLSMNKQKVVRCSKQSHGSLQKRKEQSPGTNKQKLVRLLQSQLQLKQKRMEAMQIMNQNINTKYNEVCRKMEMQMRESEQILQQNKDSKQKYQKLEGLLQKMEVEINQKTIAIQEATTKLEEATREKEIAIRQLNIFIERRVPKNVKQLQSFREAYLQNQVDQLKKILKRDKSEELLEMQRIAELLRAQLANKKEEVKNLQLQNRMVISRAQEDRKIISKYRLLKSENRNYKLTLKDMKREHEHLQTENQMLRKQFRKLIESLNISKEKKSPCRNLLRVPSQQQSLVLSLSVESR